MFFDKAQEKTHELMDELELQGDGGTTAVSAALTALIFRILINSPSVPVATGLIAVCMQNAAVMENEALADQVTELKEENSRLQLQIETTPAVEVTHEEKAGLKQHAIDTIAKIVAIDSVEITKE